MDITKLPLSEKGKAYLEKITGHPELREFCPTCHRDDAGVCSNPWHFEHGWSYVYPDPTPEELEWSMFVRAQQHDDIETWKNENKIMGIEISYKSNRNYNIWPTGEDEK